MLPGVSCRTRESQVRLTNLVDLPTGTNKPRADYTTLHFHIFLLSLVFLGQKHSLVATEKINQRLSNYLLSAALILSLV